MKAKNKVIAGDFERWEIGTSFGGTRVFISQGFAKELIYLNNSTVESYNLLDASSQKSAASGVGRGLVGSMLFGDAGAVGGALSAKNKGVYTVAVQFKDGKRSLIEMDDKCYKSLIQNCF